MRLALSLFLVSCACIPPDGPNLREHVRDRWAAVVATYIELGHTYEGAPFDDLHVTLRRGPRFGCGVVRTDGCYTGGGIECPEIEITIDALHTSALEHELVHFLLASHGIESNDHAGDFPDFFRIEYDAYRKTHPR